MSLGNADGGSVRDELGTFSPSGGIAMTRIVRIAALAAVIALQVVVPRGTLAQVPAAAKPAQSCQLGNGVKHVVEITFDNVHFFRDNPNVPSDLELMPHLRDFIEQQGVMMSNNHTPLIAH